MTLSCEHPQKIGIVEDDSGFKLTIDTRPVFIKGMNWDYFPIGTNYEYNLWDQSEDFIKKALSDEMTH